VFRRLIPFEPTIPITRGGPGDLVRGDGKRTNIVIAEVICQAGSLCQDVSACETASVVPPYVRCQVLMITRYQGVA
jgi:hypothetical protein